MKISILIHNLISTFKRRLIKNNNDKNNILYQHPQSDKLEKKLALLIKDIEAIDQADLKNVEYKKTEQEEENNLFSSYKLNFHTRIELNLFKKKYKSFLL